MGYESHAILFVGIKADDAIERTTVTDVVTKYDEDTGKPYKRTIDSPKVTLFGRPVSETGAFNVEGVWYELELDKEAPELQMCCPCPEDPHEQLIGCELKQIGTGELSVHATTVETIEAALAKVKKSLQALGYSGPDPRVFLVFAESF